jgi:hypothetical protein
VISGGLAAGLSDHGAIEVDFEYSQTWEVVRAGSVNSPTMAFGLVLESSCDCLVQGISKDARFFTTTPDVSKNSEDLKPPEVTAAVPLLKTHGIRGVTNVHAGSADGTTLFAGIDELVIYR